MPGPELLKKMIDNREDTQKVKSQALRPLLHIHVVTVPASVALLLWGTVPVQFVGGILLLAPLFFTFWQYHYFARKDPDRLGSEAFVTQARMIKFAEKAKNPSLLMRKSEVTSDPFAPPQEQKVLVAKSERVLLANVTHGHERDQ